VIWWPDACVADVRGELFEGENGLHDKLLPVSDTHSGGPNAVRQSDLYSKAVPALSSDLHTLFHTSLEC